MTEYIERDALLDDISAAVKHRGMGEIIGQTLMRYVKRQPAADVAPVVHGRWASVPCKHERICSRCQCDEPYKFADENAKVFEYCPYCGAKMDGAT